MRRKIIIIGVACLMVVLASMTVNAQDQQRKVTPVKPKSSISLATQLRHVHRSAKTRWLRSILIIPSSPSSR